MSLLLTSPLFVIFYLLIDSYQKIDILTILCNIKFYLQVPLFASSSMMIHHQHITVLVFLSDYYFRILTTLHFNISNKKVLFLQSLKIERNSNFIELHAPPPHKSRQPDKTPPDQRVDRFRAAPPSQMTANPPTAANAGPPPPPMVAPRLIEPDQNDNDQQNPLFRDVSIVEHPFYFWNFLN